MLTQKQKSVLKMVVKKLEQNKIQYIISGGLAAIFYGVNRKLYDIDIEVRKKDIQLIRKIFKKYIWKDFYHLKDESWDVNLLTLKINSVPVDINPVDDVYIFSQDGARRKLIVDLNKRKKIQSLGMEFFIEPKAHLLSYKKFLGRKTDIEDIRALSPKRK